MSFNIGIGFALDGEKEFKTGIREINSELKLLNSQSKLVEAQYASNANSLEALTAKHELLSKQMEAGQKKVELNRLELETWQGVSQRAEERVNELKQKLADAETEMSRMRGSTETTSEEIKAHQETINELNEQLKNAERAYESSENKVVKYQTSLNRAETDLAKLDNELRENGKYMGEAERSSDGLAKSINEYGNRVDEAAGKTSVFGDVLKATLAGEAIIQGVKKIASEMGELSRETVSVGMDFESSMSQAAATMGMTADEIDSGSRAFETLKTAAEASGKSTKYTASQAAEALNYLALAGYDAEKSAATLPSVLNLAAAGGLDLAYASDLVTDSMAALSMETDHLEKYIDEMARTSQKANTSVAQLGEATLVCAGTVTLTGQKLETMNTELGILANNGIKGAEGGTHLRNILLALSAPTEKAEIALRNMNIQVSDSSGSMRDLNSILTDLNTAMDHMSSAEKTQVINKIFNKTDIAAVNALLKGTGTEFDNLYKEIQSCEGAASSMADTMESNLKGKVTILQSALEGLAITAYDKIKGTLGSSVDSATGAVGRLQASMDNGKLGDSMDEFSEALNEAAGSAINFAEDALPAVIDGLTWMLENSDIVASGIAGIVAANIGMGTIAPAIIAAREAWEAYKVKTEGATIAQWLLNIAMEANPAGLLIGAIAGLTAAMITYTSINGGANAELREMNDQHEKLMDQLAAEKEKIDANIDGHSKEITAIEHLKNKIIELNSKENLSNNEKHEMIMLVDELNQVLPDLNLSINEQTGKLAENTEGWERNADAQLEALEAQFRQEDANEIARQHYEICKELTEVKSELLEKQRELRYEEEHYAQWMEDNYFTLDLERARIIADLKDSVGELSKEYGELQAASKSLEDEYKNLTGTTDAVTASTASASDAVKEMELTTVTYKNSVYEVSTDVAESMEEIEASYMEAKEKAHESIESQVGLFQELKTESELTVSQMAANLESQTEVFTNYANNLATAAELMKNDTTGQFSEIVTSIEAMGIDGAGYLDELISAWEEGNEAFDEILMNWTEMSEAKEILENTMADFETNYSESFEALLGIQSENTEAMQEDINTKLADTLSDVKLKDAETVTEVTNTLTTLNTTIKTNGETIKTTAKQVTKDTITAVETELGIVDGKSRKFNEIGKAMSSGMAEGILEGKDAVVAAAIEVANAAFEASRTTLEVNSPSRKFRRLWKSAGEGSTLGILEGKEAVIAAEKEVTEAAIQQAAQGIQQINSMQEKIIMTQDALLRHVRVAEDAAGEDRSPVQGTNIGEMTIIIQPQSLTDEELDNAFDYINNRFGSAV